MQENISNYLQYESSKYGDLPSIIVKLEKQGYLDQINTLFEKLYQEEASYTLQELTRFAQQNPENEKFDLQEQFNLNTAIFKSNFQIVLQMIGTSSRYSSIPLMHDFFTKVERIWGGLGQPKQSSGQSAQDQNPKEKGQTKKAPLAKKTAPATKKAKKSEEAQRFETDQSNNLGNTSEAKEPFKNGELEIHERETGIDDQKSPAQENAIYSSQGSSPKSSNVRSGSPPLTHLSVKNKEFMDWGNQSAGSLKVHKKGKRSINMNPNPASPLYAILHGDKNNGSSLNKTSDADRSGHLNVSVSKNVNQSAISGTRSNRSGNNSKLNASVLSVQSEFNQVKGAATFGSSPRKTMELNEISPGPAAYLSEKSNHAGVRRSPSPTFGKAPKGSWIDVVTSQNSSPGVGTLYPSHRFVAKGDVNK